MGCLIDPCLPVGCQSLCVEYWLATVERRRCVDLREKKACAAQSFQFAGDSNHKKTPTDLCDEGRRSWKMV